MERERFRVSDIETKIGSIPAVHSFSSITERMLVVLLLAWPITAVMADPMEIFAKNLSLPYVVKKTWVDNFVKFNYVLEAKSARNKIVAVGCVPTNSVDGRLLRIGDSISQHDFTFKCQQDAHGVVSYEATGCIDPLGNEISIGEARPMSNGTVMMKCGVFSGIVKKVIEKASGCMFNSTLYGEDETWVEPIDRKEKEEKEKEEEDHVNLIVDTVERFTRSRPRLGGRQAVRAEPVMRGRLMQCFRPHYHFFESQLIGCVVGKFGIRIDEYAQVEKDVYVRCVESEGGVAIKVVSVDELSCKFGNSSMPEGYVWVDEERAAEFACSAGNVVKKACILGKERVPLGKEVRVENECVFVCHPGANVYMCDKVLPRSVVIDEDRMPYEKAYTEPTWIIEKRR